MDDRITALERLAKLKSDGTISEAEFEVQKAQLFAVKFTPPILRRLWAVVTLTALIFTFWVALAILASGEVYKKRKDGWVALTKGSRWTYAGFLAVWLFALVAKTIVQPNYWDLEPSRAPVNVSQANTSTLSPEAPAVAPQASQKAAHAELGGICKQPNIAKGTPYQKARDQLTAAGYSPAPLQPEEGSFCADQYNAKTCQKMPEIEDCSADGYCKMILVDGSGAKAEVITFGDGPDGPDAPHDAFRRDQVVRAASGAGVAPHEGPVRQTAHPADQHDPQPAGGVRH
jgi:hypothetical protein